MIILQGNKIELSFSGDVLFDNINIQAEELVDQLAKITDEMNVEVVRARTLIHRKR